MMEVNSNTNNLNNMDFEMPPSNKKKKLIFNFLISNKYSIYIYIKQNR